jgi:voltage-gated potassium channel
VLFSGFLVLLTAVIVYAEHRGYKDSAHPGRPLSVIGSLYYATVTLSTTGFGDIVPVTNSARLVNVFLLTPIRVVFLIALVSTTLGVLAERTRTGWRVARWRSKVSAHTVVVGYGTKGRSAVRALLDAGVLASSIVVVDVSRHAVSEANAAGLAGVVGDATRGHVLERAEMARAERVIVAVQRDDTAVLITLTARQLNPDAMIVVAVRVAENEPLLRQSGADRVVVSADTAGRLLGLAAVRSAVGDVISDLLSCEQKDSELAELLAEHAKRVQKLSL